MRHWMKEIRSVRGFSQSEVARMSGISSSYYADIERGERRPTPSKAKSIGNVLGVDWTLFFD